MRLSNAEPAGSMHGVLTQLLSWLKAQDYAFVTVTPDTHRRVLDRRSGATARNLRDAFGWSLPFGPDLLPSSLLEPLLEAGCILAHDEVLTSTLRASTVHGDLFLHSAYPTDRPEAVFLGPDSYRFANAILESRPRSARAVLDIGAGAGVGGILAARTMVGARTVLTDVNPSALTLARANADSAGVAVETIRTDDVRQVAGDFDLIVANPPFIDDPERLTYRHGGRLGIEAALGWTEQALAKLAAGGTFLLYCGAPILAGQDPLREGLEAICRADDAVLAYREIDPDIFGEQLEETGYAEVERIAAVTARIQRL